ncbi:hypothetical protein LJK87_35150 [Paenibacillus sp. P25]|nr:hypothetical protein LJK87_35150 [Paenibacillus sp. P25]
MPSRKKDPAAPTETAPADSAGTTQDSAENKVVPLETKPARRRVKAAPSTAEAADEPAAPKKPRRTRTAAAKKPAKQAPPEAEAPRRKLRMRKPRLQPYRRRSRRRPSPQRRTACLSCWKAS